MVPRACMALALILIFGPLLASLPATAAQPASERYIVVLRPGIASPAAARSEITGRYGLKPSHVYRHALNGFAAEMPAQAAAALERDPRVAFVEPDRPVYVAGQTTPISIHRIAANKNPTANIDGVDDRVDVDVAVIDTGVDADHPDLNVSGGVDCTGV